MSRREVPRCLFVCSFQSKSLQRFSGARLAVLGEQAGEKL